ncbi:MAG: hypothetical protein HY778_14600 [Betaproteobacteria bacterium]|nr:hypothetical protein [Betaproteobacteria bacterium]
MHVPTAMRRAFHSVKRADELGDLHQLALAVHNAWQFGRESGLPDMARQYETRLKLLLRARKALRVQMRREGYQV